MNKVCVTLEVLVLLSISVVLMVFGALLTIPANYGTSYIENNCELGQSGQFSEMDMYSRQIFEPMVNFDQEYQIGVNQQMCTQFC